MVKVVWSDAALMDLDDIGNYIAKDSIRYAQLTVKRLFNSVDILEKNPSIGKELQEFDNEKIRELIRFNYRIVYFLVDEYRIDILTVHRCERLPGNAFDFDKLEK